MTMVTTLASGCIERCRGRGEGAGCARMLAATGGRRRGSPAVPTSRSGPGAAGSRSDAAAGRRLRWSTPGRPRARPLALCSPPLRANRAVPSRHSVSPSPHRSTPGSTSSRTKRPSARRVYRTSRARSASLCSAPVWRARARRKRRRHRARAPRRPSSPPPPTARRSPPPIRRV